jgi:hypothetical protein
MGGVAAADTLPPYGAELEPEVMVVMMTVVVVVVVVVVVCCATCDARDWPLPQLRPFCQRGRSCPTC